MFAHGARKLGNTVSSTSALNAIVIATVAVLPDQVGRGTFDVRTGEGRVDQSIRVTN